MSAEPVELERFARGCPRIVHGDLVVGVHWTPVTFGSGTYRTRVPADLDVVCELRQSSGHLLELVSPARLRSSNECVVHTGDSRTGASRWDDERIFVFLAAVPPQVDSLTFSVVSNGGEWFCNIPGASCHISDCATEEPLLRLGLGAFGAVTGHTIATLQRSPRGWTLEARGLDDV